MWPKTKVGVWGCCVWKLPIQTTCKIVGSIEPRSCCITHLFICKRLQKLTDRFARSVVNLGLVDSSSHLLLASGAPSQRLSSPCIFCVCCIFLSLKLYPTEPISSTCSRPAPSPAGGASRVHSSVHQVNSSPVQAGQVRLVVEAAAGCWMESVSQC